jgi:hypothetical protein
MVRSFLVDQCIWSTLFVGRGAIMAKDPDETVFCYGSGIEVARLQCFGWLSLVERS